jgi:hypothetical protein
MAPSSSLGTNSDPRRVATTPLLASTAIAAASTTHRSRSAPRSAGSYNRRAPATSRLSFSDRRRGSIHDAIAGMNVMARTSAPMSANSTVIAIGRNIFPSMPVSARIGR